MFYRVYTKTPSLRLNAVKHIHTSPSSYAQQQREVPQTQRGPRSPVTKTQVTEESVVDEPYGE